MSDRLTLDDVRERLRRLVTEAAKRPPFDRPLKVGDPEQAAAMRAINGDRPYCPLCWHVSKLGLDAVDTLCTQCRRGLYLPGAAMEAAWLEHMSVEDD